MASHHNLLQRVIAQYTGTPGANTVAETVKSEQPQQQFGWDFLLDDVDANANLPQAIQSDPNTVHISTDGADGRGTVDADANGDTELPPFSGYLVVSEPFLLD